MTRTQAQALIADYFRRHQLPHVKLGEYDRGGADWPDGCLFFEFEPETGQLHWWAKIHNLRAQLDHRPLLEALEQAVQAGEDTGGGTLTWHAPSRGFFLRRSYSGFPGDTPAALDAHALEVDRLAAAGLRWLEGRYRELLLAWYARQASHTSAQP